MIPKGHTEDPFVYPAMACQICRHKFIFLEPFYECHVFKCPNCKQMSDIPQQVIEQFIENQDFIRYLNRNQPPPPAT